MKKKVVNPSFHKSGMYHENPYKRLSQYRRRIGKRKKRQGQAIGKHQHRLGTSTIQPSSKMIEQDIQSAMTDHDKLMAAMSKQAYDHAKGNKVHFHQNYHLVDQFSGDDWVIYRDPEKKKSIIAYRGTDPSKGDDLLADAHIAAGTTGLSTRFRLALQNYHRVRNHFKGDNIHLTGHSLGGALANHVSEQTGASATTFNPGAGAGTLIASKNAKGKRRILRTTKDIVSKAHALKGGDDNTTIVDVGEGLGYLDAHSIDNFY